MNNLEVVRLKNAVNERDHVAGLQNAPVTLLEYRSINNRGNRYGHS